MEDKWTLNELYQMNEFSFMTNALGEERTEGSVPEGVMEWYENILTAATSSLLYLVKICNTYGVLAINEFDNASCENLFNGSRKKMLVHVINKSKLLEKNSFFKDCMIYYGIESGFEKCDEIGVLFSMYNHSTDTIQCGIKELDSIIYSTDLPESLNGHSLQEKIYIARNLYKSVPDGLITDCDTLLADIEESSGMKITGLSMEIFNIWEKSTDRPSVEKMFFTFTGTGFSEYLDSCIKNTTRKKDDTYE